MSDIKSVESSTGGQPGFSISMGEGETVEKIEDDATEYDPTGENAEQEDAPAKAAGDDQENDEEVVEGDGEDEGEDDAEDLGDFDPENAEAWDERYFPEGQMDKGLLSKEFFKNMEAGEAGLNPATYDYLETRGISKGVAKEVEAALMTQRDAEAGAVESADYQLMEAAGGPDALKAALEWGKGGGYDQKEQTAFNKATSSKDPEVRRAAVESLMFRYGKNQPKEKPKVPRRDATKGGVSNQGREASVQPFQTRAEWREAKAKAGDNQAALRKVALRLSKSEF